MRRLAVVLAMCAGAAAVVDAQSADELAQRLPNQTGHARAHTLAELTGALRQDNPGQALKYGEEAITLFAKHQDVPGQVRTLNAMSWAYMVLSDDRNAVSFAERGRALAERHGDVRGGAQAANNLGVFAERRGDALQAVDFFSEAVTGYRKVGADVEISAALDNLGLLYSTALADHETGLAHHIEALAVRERLGDKPAVALSLDSIGISYHRIGELDRALSYFERALRLRRDIGGDNRIAATLSNIGDVHHSRKDFARALEFHTQALQLRRKIGDPAGIASSLRNLGVAQSEMDNAAEARRHLNEALSIATNGGDRAVAAQAHLGLALLDREHGSRTERHRTCTAGVGDR